MTPEIDKQLTEVEQTEELINFWVPVIVVGISLVIMYFGYSTLV